ncbi:TolC family outer membrane protein [Sulfurimonas sp.]
MKRKILLSLFIGLSLNAADLKTTLNELISTNPIILERLQNYNATQEDIDNAQSGYYPKLDLNLGAGYEKTQRTNQAGGTADKTYNFNVYQNSLKYTQNLFNGFSTTNLVKEQELKTVAAAYNYIEKVNNTSFDFVNAYLELMKNHELLETAQENVQINADILSKVKRLYKSGFTTLSEVNKIESSLALAKSNLVVQENNILDKSFTVERLLGHKLDINTMSKPSKDIIIPQTKEAIIKLAMQNNPSLLVSEFNKRVAQATNKEKKANYYPKLDIEISQSMNKNLSGIEGNDDTFRAMAYLSYNIFNGFSDKHSIAKSYAQIEQENQNIHTNKRKILETINSAWASNKKLQEQLIDLKNYNKYSSETLDLYRKEYSLGQRSLLDLLSSQNDLIKSKEQVINTNYSILYAKYRLLDAMSMLVTSILDNTQVYSHVGLKKEGSL